MNKQIKLNRQLLRAVKTNSCDQIESLLRQGADPLANKCRTLVVAIERGRVPILEKFVRHGINLSQHHINPLQTASTWDQFTTLEYLLNACLNLPSELKAVCMREIWKDSETAMAMLLAEVVEFEFDLIIKCVEHDSINWFRAIEPKYDLQPQAAAIVTDCVSHSSDKILVHMLDKYMVAPQALNDLLIQVACDGPTEILEILIKYGANCPVKSTEAFILTLQNDRISAAELLLPNVNLSHIDDQDLAHMACYCAWDVCKSVLKRGWMNMPVELAPEYATDVVQMLKPEDFFMLDEGLPVTKDFLKQRLSLCGDLAKAALVYSKWEGYGDKTRKTKINLWLRRCMEIKFRMHNSAL